MTLGQLFKNKRNELGRSLEQISASTRIHIKTLTALENDEYAELPARTFTRGFIITYCKALRLDSNEVLKNYHDFLDSKFSERSARDKGHQGYVFEGKELEQNKRWMVIGATLAVFFAISVLLIFKPQNSHRKEKHKEFVEEASPAPGTNDEDATDTEVAAPNLIAAIPSITASPHLATSATPIASVVPAVAVVAITSPSPTASPSATATPAPVAVVTVSPTPIPSVTPKEDKLNKGDDLAMKDVKKRILFEALDDVWVRYQADDRAPTIFVLRKGRQLVIKAKDQLKFETNNPSALRYRSRSSQYSPLEQSNFAVEANGTLSTISAGNIAPSPLPTAIPTSATP